MCAPLPPIFNYANIAKKNSEKVAATALASAKAELFSAAAAKNPPPNFFQYPNNPEQHKLLSNDLNNNNIEIIFNSNR